jgi:hypothetical protein
MRPDFYGAATASDTVRLRGAFDQILTGLHLTARPGPVPAAFA